MGDGINDAPALHASGVGISVNSAVDVAKQAATVVLLEKDLGVLCAGVREGRRTFANTLKYIFMTTSANFGNMFSMALVFVLKAGPEEFRTGWFVESVMTEILIILVMRTWRPFYESKVSRTLLIAMILVLIITFALPYSPLSELLGFKPLPLSAMLVLGLITLLYVAASEAAKRIFLRISAKKYAKDLLIQPESKWKSRHGPCSVAL